MDYKEAYYTLFRAITRAIYKMEAPVMPIETAQAVKILKDAQTITEEMYIGREE